ncbi:MAG: NAD(P)/FAD-dependent oxidoreductase [Sporolactobacillus sp.]
MGKPKILILGAGYGGLMTTVHLTKELAADEADITLVNKHNYHYQTTLLHETAAGTYDANQVRVLINQVIDTRRVTFIQDEVVSIDHENKKVILQNGEQPYDYLVIGLGFESNTFGIPGLDKYAFAIRNVDTACQIRDHIESQFAAYAGRSETDGAADDNLTIVVGGAGLSGIEFIGELVNRLPQLARQYSVPLSKIKIINVEGLPMILPPFSRDLAGYAQKYLESKGVIFRLGTFIKEATEDGVKVQKKDSESMEAIKAGTVVWTGGVKASAIPSASGLETNRGKLEVNADLTAKVDSHIFPVGDVAVIFPKEGERPYPPTAQMAVQESVFVARNLKHLIRNEATEPFAYHPQGTLASLGNKVGIGTVFGKKLTGKSASAMKKIADDRYLLHLGGLGLMVKKGKFNFL